MIGYFDYFPEKAKTELRTATFVDEGRRDLIPPGMYVFTEYFCTEPACCCQRLLVKVLRVTSEHARPEEVATFSYAWNAHSDETWSRLNAELPNPFLDPFHRNTSYASDLLDFWHDMLQRDTAYADRIERHCDELRAALCQTSTRSGTPPRISSAVSPRMQTMPSLHASPTLTGPTLTGPTLTAQERRARKRKLEQTKRCRKSR